jgi:hypothetical protein
MTQIGCGGILGKALPIGVKQIALNFKSQKDQGILRQKRTDIRQ